MNDAIIPLVVAVIGSSALWQTIVFLIDRFDKRKKSNEDVLREMNEVKESVIILADKVDKNQAVLARTHILRFSDELRNGVHHSDEYFRQQLQDCDTYETFCKSHPEFKNSYTELANKNIKETYETLLREGKL